MAVDRRYASVIAIFATALFLALVVCASGLISLIANREVLVEKDAGPLIAPVMFAVATAALYVQLVSARARRGGSIILSAALIGVIVFVFYNIAGATLYSLGSGEPLRGILFFAANALGPYSVSVGIAAVVVAFSYLMLLSFRDSGGVKRTPRWPWEDRDDRAREDRE